MMLEVPKTAPNNPLYRPLSAGGKRSAITVNAMEKIPAAPRPCTARNTISSVMLRDCPESMEPARNRMTPVSTMSLRP